MTLSEFSLTIFIVAYCSGVLGVLTGLGGGVIIVPVLMMAFKIDVRLAMAVSLVSVMATSSGAAIAFRRKNYTNIRLGIFLESTAVAGAIVGALLVHVLPVRVIAVTFGIVLLIAAAISLKTLKDRRYTAISHPWARTLRLDTPEYHVYRVPAGLGIMTMAGMLSGLLGIGSGAFKVIALDLAMGLPYKAATSTSNFMLGITATAGAGIYLASGYVNQILVFPTMLGMLFGAWTGAKIFMLSKPEKLRVIFDILVLCLAAQMIYKGVAL